ncbi:HTH domain-containing protein [Cohnella lubricantis]|uniref:DNA-binding response regulator n=1 Tax=Cohnella lubricantis TaxID=2163172 RepID=A0A841TEX7_9BACL|nr:HTH domain-containing protein [Cohnella lubricantis]MBB6678826.1 hypothetical protein [Cohnella lubricantis]
MKNVGISSRSGRRVHGEGVRGRSAPTDRMEQPSNENREEDLWFQSDPAFARAYEQMMKRALVESRGERKRRLLENHGRGEKMLVARVLWPVFGSLENLHPEYEIRDLRGGVNFVDYAYIPSRQLGLLLECDGFGPHWRDISRWEFDRNEERQNLLLIDEWKMLRFSYDAVREKSERCQQTLRLALAKWGQIMPEAGEGVRLGVYERAILHLHQTSGREIITPAKAARELGITSKTAIKHLQSLEDKGHLTAIISATGRRMGYAAQGEGSVRQMEKRNDGITGGRMKVSD